MCVVLITVNEFPYLWIRFPSLVTSCFLQYKEGKDVQPVRKTKKNQKEEIEINNNNNSNKNNAYHSNSFLRG